jgi:hypothetical protein
VPCKQDGLWPNIVWNRVRTCEAEQLRRLPLENNVDSLEEEREVLFLQLDCVQNLQCSYAAQITVQCVTLALQWRGHKDLSRLVVMTRGWEQHQSLQACRRQTLNPSLTGTIMLPVSQR